jgi:hypothetical protein
LAEGATEAFGKGGGIGSYFSLGKAAKVFLKEIFDRIFNRDDVTGSSLIEPFEARGQRGGFSGPSGSRYENESRWAREPLLQKFCRQAELFHGGNLSFDVTENGTADTELAMEVHAEAKA